ncbi:MAG: hypothetical protein U0263_41720, partial [Polyangiaceae bacterium]
MARRATGEVRKDADGNFSTVIRMSGNRQTFDLPTCRTKEDARERSALLANLAKRFRKAGVIESEQAIKLIEMAAAAAPALLKGVLQVAGELVGGELAPEGDADRLTFGDVGKKWTSGDLHREHPDHVRRKDSDLDAARLEKLCAIDVGGMRLGDIPVDRFTIDHAESAMRALNEALGKRKAESSATRRAYAQLIHRVLALAVYPLRVIPIHPLPRGFMPKVGKPPAFSFLYPAEDAKLLACSEVPLLNRLLYGVLGRLQDCSRTNNWGCRAGLSAGLSCRH